MRAIASHSQLSRLLDGALTRSPGTASARLTRTRSSTAPSSWKQWQAAPAWSEHTPNCCFVMIYSKLSQTSSVSTYGSCSMCALPPVSPPCLPNYSQFDSCAPRLSSLCTFPALSHTSAFQAGGMLRHLRSLRRMDHDHGWIHTLLEEAENERMHLLTFIRLKQPGPLFRLSVVATQVSHPKV